MDLQLPLKKNWFEMTKKGVKKEDYRDINPYWCNRLLKQNGRKQKQSFWKLYLDNFNNKEIRKAFNNGCKDHRLSQIVYSNNIMTLGYPKKQDSERILKLEHLGLEIRTGNTEWGAEPDKLYFVIKHGVIN